MSAADQRARDQLASEYALGVLEGAELAQAQALLGSDAAFRTAVARWAGQLAPLLDEVEPVAPPETAWRNIERRTAQGHGDTSNVVSLKRRVRVWQGVATGAMALAASLAVVLAIPREPLVTQRPAAPPMVAMLGDAREMKVVASWDPAGRRLVLAVAGDMPQHPTGAHELWIIPANGKPRSLGTMPESPRTHVVLADALAELMRQGATIAISVEPSGGSPTGQPTGPVIASGALEGA